MKVARIANGLCLSLAIAACAGETDGPPPTAPPETPAIVEVFACSDYCPGPEEQYIRRVYEGVTDEEECRRLGGRLLKIKGWGTRTFCEVK